MSAARYLFNLYEQPGAADWLLLRTVCPDYPNSSQAAEDAALSQEQTSRERLLGQHGGPAPRLLGRCEELPVGEALYGPATGQRLPLYYQPTRYGPPYVVLGTAATTAAYRAALADDDLLALAPLGEVVAGWARFWGDELP